MIRRQKLFTFYVAMEINILFFSNQKHLESLFGRSEQQKDITQHYHCQMTINTIIIVKRQHCKKDLN
jgi:hypothetical protein